MAGSIFSKDYYLHRQAEFTRALEGGRIAEAVGILEGFPGDDKIVRAITLVEGYRALFEKARRIIGAGSDGLDRYRQAGTLDDFEAYKKLGTPQEIEQAQERLKEYEELGELKEVSSRLDELDGFKELGSFENVESEVNQNYRLRDSLSALDIL